jgi:hypothetical protein
VVRKIVNTDNRRDINRDTAMIMDIIMVGVYHLVIKKDIITIADIGIHGNPGKDIIEDIDMNIEMEDIIEIIVEV